MPALVLDGGAKGFAVEEFARRERARKPDLDDPDGLALVADLMINIRRGRRGLGVVVRFRQMQAQLPDRPRGGQLLRPVR
jgi:hypothetical protein